MFNTFTRVFGRQLIAVFAFCAIGIVGIASIHASRRFREVASDDECRAAMSRIARAIDFYRKKTGSPPPIALRDHGGNLLCSWRVLLLPQFQGIRRDYRFDEPYDSEHNRRLWTYIHNQYHCHTDESTDLWEASYFLVRMSDLTQVHDKNGAPLAAFGSGGKELVLVECVGTGIHWMEPRDIRFGTRAGEGERVMMLASPDAGGPALCLIDGKSVPIRPFGSASISIVVPAVAAPSEKSIREAGQDVHD